MPTLVIQHHDIGRAGRLGAALRDHGHRLRIVRPDRGEPIPPDLDDAIALVSLGGPQNLDDPPGKHAWMQREMELIAQAHTRMLPVVGVCLGAQLIAAALGGEVAPMPAPEIGLADINIAPPGQTDVALAGLAWRQPQFSHHSREIAKPPEGATVLASSQRCKVQAFRVGLRTYGFQFHFEADERIIRELVASAPDDLSRAGVLADDIDKQLTAHYATFDRLSWRLSENIAELVAPIHSRRVVA